MMSITHKGVEYTLLAEGAVCNAYREYRQRTHTRYVSREVDNEEPNEDEVTRCRTWIKRYAKPRKTTNRLAHSYTLKHYVERHPVSQGYVSNGAFILAAFLEGYRPEPAGYRSPNAWFNMKLLTGYTNRVTFQDPEELQDAEDSRLSL